MFGGSTIHITLDGNVNNIRSNIKLLSVYSGMCKEKCLFHIIDLPNVAKTHYTLIIYFPG